MTTPAQKRGIQVNVTQLRYAYDDLIYVLIEDDGSNLPFFRSICGTNPFKVFNLNNMTIVADTTVPPIPAALAVPVQAVCLPAAIEQRIAQEDASHELAREVGIRAFRLMLESANIGRTGGGWKDYFYSHHGICDNIPSHVEQVLSSFNRVGSIVVTYHRYINEIKNNLIRRTASYSGDWNYPVQGVDGKSAEDLWDNSENKWVGEYGANRVQQLEELIVLLADDSVWHTDLCRPMPPCRALGFKVGEIYMHKQTNELWRLESDDESRNPYFRRVSDNERDAIYLSELVPCSVVHENKTVAEFIQLAEEVETKVQAIQTQMAELKRQLDKANGELAVIDMALAQQHKVKRIK